MVKLEVSFPEEEVAGDLLCCAVVDE